MTEKHRQSFRRMSMEKVPLLKQKILHFSFPYQWIPELLSPCLSPNNLTPRVSPMKKYWGIPTGGWCPIPLTFESPYQCICPPP